VHMLVPTKISLRTKLEMSSFTRAKGMTRPQI